MININPNWLILRSDLEFNPLFKDLFEVIHPYFPKETNSVIPGTICYSLTNTIDSNSLFKLLPLMFVKGSKNKFVDENNHHYIYVLNYLLELIVFLKFKQFYDLPELEYTCSHYKCKTLDELKNKIDSQFSKISNTDYYGTSYYSQLITFIFENPLDFINIYEFAEKWLSYTEYDLFNCMIYPLHNIDVDKCNKKYKLNDAISEFNSEVSYEIIRQLNLYLNKQ